MGERENGEIAFNAYYEQLFNLRWSELLKSLKGDSQQVLWLNPWSNSDLKNQIGIKDLPVFKADGVNSLIEFFDYHGQVPERTAEGLLSHYVLDLGSVFVAEALGVQENDLVLDMCAAPGGKSLLLLAKLGSQGRLVANEFSHDRRMTLLQILRQYVPDSNAYKYKVTGFNAEKWGLFEKDVYDKVLVDAPCSGEKYLLRHPNEMAKWSRTRSERLARRQYTILCAALTAVKPKGTIVYSTCSISQTENDDVIKKILNKKKDLITLNKLNLDIGEPTEFGWQILPDKTGFGPLYFSQMHKIPTI